MSAILNNPEINNLLFLHVPKCAGTTFLFILNRQYAHLKAFEIVALKPDQLNIDLFIDLPEAERATYNLIRGHMVYGLHEHLVGPSAYITFLRHPVNRVVSLYHFMKNNPENRMYPIIHKHNLSLEDFVTKINDRDINNSQINRIGGMPFENEQQQYEKAIEHIENHFPIVGIVEKYDESLLLMKNYYHWKMPYYATVNKNKKKPKQELSDDVKQIILERNQGDLKLYEQMKNKLEQEINMSGKAFQKELKSFKQINKLFVHRHLYTAYSKLRSFTS